MLITYECMTPDYIEAQPYPCSQRKMSLSREFWEQPRHLLTPSPTWELGMDSPSLSDWLRSQSPRPGDLWVMSLWPWLLFWYNSRWIPCDVPENLSYSKSFLLPGLCWPLFCHLWEFTGVRLWLEEGEWYWRQEEGALSSHTNPPITLTLFSLQVLPAILAPRPWVHRRPCPPGSPWTAAPATPTPQWVPRELWVQWGPPSMPWALHIVSSLLPWAHPRGHWQPLQDSIWWPRLALR